MDSARELVANRMEYCRRNSFDSPARAFERGYGFCTQQAYALAELLRLLGVEAKVVHDADTLDKMLPRLRDVIASGQPNDEKLKKVFHKEEVLDIMQKEVTIFVTDLLAGSLTVDLADEGRRIVRMADEYESAGDYVQNILKLYLRLEQADLKLSQSDCDSILDLHDDVTSYVDLISTACRQNRIEVVTKADALLGLVSVEP